MIQNSLLSIAAALIIFSGCDGSIQNNNTDYSGSNTIAENDKSISEKAEVKLSHTIIESGETVDFALSDTSGVKSIEWRDKNGKLLSTSLKFNRLFIEEGEYDTIAVVTDKNNKIITDKVTVKVIRSTTVVTQTPNMKPVSKISAEAVEIMDEEYIHLSDDGSYDPDGEIVKYEWRDMDGILLSSTKNLDRKMHYWPQYDQGDGTTRYVKTLYVTDDKGAVSSSSIEIIVRKKPSTNKAPTVDAGKDQTITSGETVTLNAIANDPDGTIVKYEWKEGSVVKSNDPALTLENLSTGTHIFTITVTDDKGATADDTVVITVTAPVVTNQAPIADAGADANLVLGDRSIKLDASASYDPEGNSLTYQWEVIKKPAGSTINTTLSNEKDPYFNADKAGEYHIRLTVSDGSLFSTPDEVIVTVEENPNDIYTFYGTMVDKNSGLMWQNNRIYRWKWNIGNNEPIDVKDSQIEYHLEKNATIIDLCESMTYAGYSDWRVPTIEELEDLQGKYINDSQYNELIKNGTEYFVNQTLWSSTESQTDPNKAWKLYFSSGPAKTHSKTISHHVICVRNTQINND